MLFSIKTKSILCFQIEFELMASLCSIKLQEKKKCYSWPSKTVEVGNSYDDGFTKHIWKRR